PGRQVPHQVDVRPDAVRVDEVDRSVADHLVGDRGAVWRLRVASLGDVHALMLRRRGASGNGGLGESRPSSGSLGATPSPAPTGPPPPIPQGGAPPGPAPRPRGT